MQQRLAQSRGSGEDDRVTREHVHQRAEPKSSLRPRRPDSFRPDIEGLRGIAVVLALAFHAGLPGGHGGFIGVDMFFVLSGYLITGVLWDEYERAGRISLTNFYARRARRLLPASAFVLAATIGAACWVYSPLEQGALASTARSAAAYLSNFWFGSRATDYLAGRGDTNPFLHTWSLAVEEQFYLLWPAVLIGLLWWLAPKRSPETVQDNDNDDTDARRDRNRVVAAVAVLTLASLLLSQWLLHAAAPWAYFASPSRAWEFGLGAMARLALFRSRPIVSGNNRSLLVAFGLATIALAAVVLSRRTPFPGFAALLPTVGTTAVLVGGAGDRGTGDWSSRILRAGPLRRLGLLSYSWYLWHWPVLVLATAVLGPLSVLGRTACVVASLGAAAATWALVESPVRYWHWLIVRPGLTLALAVALTVGSVAGAWGWRWLASAESANGPRRAFFEAQQEVPALYDQGCGMSLRETESPACEFGDTASQTAVVLFGDSHAVHWFPALEPIALKRHWKLVVLTKPGCPAPDITVWLDGWMREYAECNVWRERALERIARLRPFAVVVANSTKYMGIPDALAPAVRVRPGLWLDGLRRTFTRLSAAADHVILIRDTPYPGFDVPACLARADWHGSDVRQACLYPHANAAAASLADAEMKLVGRVARSGYLDLADEFCSASVCNTIQPAGVVFRDEDHLAVRFAASLSPVLSRQLDRVMSTQP